MSTETRPNRLALILAGIVMLVVIGAGLRRCTQSAGPSTPTAVVPSRPADADGVDATMKTMTARLGEVAELNQRQQTQDQRLAQLESQLVAESPKQLEAQVSELAVLLRDLQASQLALTDRLASIEVNRSSAPTTGNGIPPEFGISPDAQLAATNAPAPIGLTSFPIGTGSLVPADTWIYPLDHPNNRQGHEADQDAFAVQDGPELTESAITATPRLPEPRFTVPVNATLLNARAMTALIGRVPIQGQLQDPYPVKVVVGPEGLATNGLTLPADLRGMVFSGVARGDWGLSCVRAQLLAVTFTFEDGTIRTLSGEGEDALGYISDAAGNPCINGERITNAPKVLAARFAASAFEAAARGFAQAQTNQVVTNGSVVTTVDDAARFGAYTGLAGGAEDAQDWLEDRLGQSFDAVYAPPGEVVAVHLQKALEIDFESEGRKLVHAQRAGTTAGALD